MSNDIYVPEVIQDEKPKELFYWKTEEERIKHEEEQKKRQQEIADMDFSYEQLQDLDTSTKDEYMKRILNEDAQISSYIKNVFEKIEDTEDKIINDQL